MAKCSVVCDATKLAPGNAEYCSCSQQVADCFATVECGKYPAAQLVASAKVNGCADLSAPAITSNGEGTAANGETTTKQNGDNNGATTTTGGASPEDHITDAGSDASIVAVSLMTFLVAMLLQIQ